MKIRHGFVANSSSSSFYIHIRSDTEEGAYKELVSLLNRWFRDMSIEETFIFVYNQANEEESRYSTCNTLPWKPTRIFYVKDMARWLLKNGKVLGVRHVGSKIKIYENELDNDRKKSKKEYWSMRYSAERLAQFYAIADVLSNDYRKPTKLLKVEISDDGSDNNSDIDMYTIMCYVAKDPPCENIWELSNH